MHKARVQLGWQEKSSHQQVLCSTIFGGSTWRSCYFYSRPPHHVLESCGRTDSSLHASDCSCTTSPTRTWFPFRPQPLANHPISTGAGPPHRHCRLDTVRDAHRRSISPSNYSLCTHRLLDQCQSIDTSAHSVLSQQGSCKAVAQGCRNEGGGWAASSSEDRDVLICCRWSLILPDC